jgi:hypothetical protein
MLLYIKQCQISSNCKKQSIVRFVILFLVNIYIIYALILVCGFKISHIVTLDKAYQEQHVDNVDQNMNVSLSSMVKPSAFTGLTLGDNAREGIFPMTIHLYDIYANEQELMQRSLRFPSVEVRLKLYMTTWYIPPCPNNSFGKVQYNYVYENENTSRKKGVAATSGLKVLLQPLTYGFTNDGLLLRMNQRKKADRKEYDKSSSNVLLINSTAHLRRDIFLYDREHIEKCNLSYCGDVRNFMNPSLDRILTLENSGKKYTAMLDEEKFPIMLQFGDSEMYTGYAPAKRVNAGNVFKPMIPLLRKYRYSMTKLEIDRVTTILDGNCYAANQSRLLAETIRDPRPSGQAIVSPVCEYNRHFGQLKHVIVDDIQWEHKKNIAVFRGAITGRNKASKGSKDLQFCAQVPRCNMVYRYHNSSLVDAKATQVGNNTYPELSEPLNGVRLFGNRMNVKEMLQYKAIIMLEGNDVSTGFKWALFSNSVVLTQTPTCTSWAMEELLQPWVHYIPLSHDLSDVEEKVQWIVDHDNDAQQIARNGRLWIADLMYHPDATKDNEWIIDETLKRYRSHFTYNSSLEIK